MDWTALALSLKLGLASVADSAADRHLPRPLFAWKRFRGKAIAEALLALPLVLPPTVLGFYLLIAFGGASPLGRGYQLIVGHPLVFSFEGLLLASIIINLPFAVQPMQRAFAAIPEEIRAAGACSGLAPWQVLLRIDLPLAWPGIVTGLVLAFAHTLGEFGVVLMVGGSIPGRTETISIAIYDRVQAFDNGAAGIMSVLLLAFSLAALTAIYMLSSRVGRRDG